MYEEKLLEINTTELKSEDRSYKYVITCYDDITEIKYFEKNNEDKLQENKNGSFNLPSVHDIQICEKIIEMRKQADKEI